MPFGRKPSDNRIESFPFIGNTWRSSPLNENKVTLRSAGASESTDTAAMPLWYAGEGKRHDFHVS